jgi:hypothetical protein
MVFNVTFNNISTISRRSVLLVEETGASGENLRPVAGYRQTVSHNVVSSTPHHERCLNSQLNEQKVKLIMLVANKWENSF